MIGKRTNDLHIVFLRRCCPIIVTRMKLELSSFLSRGSQFNSTTILVFVLSLPPFLLSHCFYQSPSCARHRISFLWLPRTRCIRGRACREIPGCRGFGETFNREWNSRWNVNETQLDYTYTLFPGYSQSFAEIPGCFQRDEIPAW